MIADVKTPVSAKLYFNHKKGTVFPYEILWEGSLVRLKRVDLHYKYMVGKTLFHVFSVVSEDMYFKLVLDTRTLFWTVEQYSDALPD